MKNDEFYKKKYQRKKFIERDFDQCGIYHKGSTYTNKHSQYYRNPDFYFSRFRKIRLFLVNWHFHVHFDSIPHEKEK